MEFGSHWNGSKAHHRAAERISDNIRETEERIAFTFFCVVWQLPTF